MENRTCPDLGFCFQKQKWPKDLLTVMTGTRWRTTPVRACGPTAELKTLGFTLSVVTSHRGPEQEKQTVLRVHLC